MPSERDKKKRWRPWQFSLRTMMLLMFGASCFLGGWTSHEWKRRRALELEAKMGAEYEAEMYEYMEAEIESVGGVYLDGSGRDVWRKSKNSDAPQH
jgi:hypothetical protein